MKVSRSAQTCALGSAMFGAVVGGHFANIQQAADRMSGLKETVYTPKLENVAVYDRLFVLYRMLHDSFGTRDDRLDLFPVMKDLLEIKRNTAG